MRALAPYLASAALLLPPPVATIRAMPDPVAEAGIFIEVGSHGSEYATNDLATYTWDLKRPDLAPDFIHGLLVEDGTETYEPFIAAEAWREIVPPMGPVKIEFEERPTSFLDEHDLAGIDIYE